MFGSYSASSGSSIAPDLGSALSPAQILSQIAAAKNGSIPIPVCNEQISDGYSLVFFFIGNILLVFGSTPLYSVGPSFIDDIVRPKYVSLHLGFFMHSPFLVQLLALV